MAYASQDLKAKVNANLKQVIPSDWKWSLSVRHYSTLVLTIRQAPVDLIGDYVAHNTEAFRQEPGGKPSYCEFNPHYLQDHFSAANCRIMLAIRSAMNTDNWDRSNTQTDYFDVGHYITIQAGRWDRPFVIA